MKTFLFFVFMATITMAQGIRPDDLVNLRAWIKSDSLESGGATYGNGVAIDSAYNWGSIGGAFTQASTGRPIFRTNISPTGLPAADFDGVNDALVHGSSNALYKFLHDGGDYTFVFVFKLKSVGVYHTLFSTNSTGTLTSANVGFGARINSDNSVMCYVTKGVGGQVIIDNTTVNQFDDTESIQFAVMTYDTDENPDHVIRMNGEQQTTDDATSLPHTSANSTVDARISVSSTHMGNYYFFELILYSDKKSDSEIASLLEYLYYKWAGTHFPGTPTNLDTTYVQSKEIAIEWTKEDSAIGGYKVYRQNDPSHNSYPTWQFLEETVDEDDTTFVDVLRLPGITHKYRVRATNDTLVTNHSNTLTVTTDVLPSTYDSLYTSLLQKWTGVSQYVATVENLDTVEVNVHTIELQWDQIPGVDGYKIYRQFDPTHNSYPGYSLAATNFGSSNNSFTGYRINSGEQRRYKVRAYDGSFNGNHSNIMAVITDDSCYTEPPLTGLENYISQKWITGGSAWAYCSGETAMPGLIRRRGEARRGE